MSCITKLARAGTKLDKVSSTDEYCVSGECWYTDSYDLPDLTGGIDFKVVATINPIPSWCQQWGINAFSWAKLSEEEKQIPEFGTIAALVALAGAVTAFLVLRKS